ncbi:MAG TPA: hypothetical protein VH309_06780 [Elusimicrobiota bacterium]|jgi:hypothetical protein|nr:hypothetical protein [Elusimicrobiota bacterium]
MKIALSSLCLLLASGAYAADAFPAFGSVSFDQLRAVKANVAVPPAQAGDVITDYHMIAQAGKDCLFGYADNEAQAAQATAYWTAVLKAAGIRTGAATFADGMYQIPYKTADGRVIRDFLADSRQFPPKDEAGLRDNMALAAGALNKAGLAVVSTRVLNVDAILPTYSVLYLTRPNDLPEHETRLRVLAPGDDLDFGIFRGAGVSVIQTPKTWMMVYIGPEVGYVSLIAQTEDDLDAKVAKRLEFLASEGKKLIAQRREPVDDPDYKFGAALYFFQ